MQNEPKYIFRSAYKIIQDIIKETNYSMQCFLFLVSKLFLGTIFMCQINSDDSVYWHLVSLLHKILTIKNLSCYANYY